MKESVHQRRRRDIPKMSIVHHEDLENIWVKDKKRSEETRWKQKRGEKYRTGISRKEKTEKEQGKNGKRENGKGKKEIAEGNNNDSNCKNKNKHKHSRGAYANKNKARTKVRNEEHNGRRQKTDKNTEQHARTLPVDMERSWSLTVLVRAPQSSDDTP